MDFTRRAMLGAMGGLAVGGSIAAMSGNVIAAPAAPEMSGGKDGLFDQQYGLFGWKAHKIDDIAGAMDVAYKGYWYKGLGCGYGAFYAIVNDMAKKYGAPYNTFPYSIMEMFKGGFGDWGTICGALAGAGAAFSLFYGRKESKPMVAELFRWYEKTAFPIYNPGEAAQGFKGDLPTSVSNSVLCHISVSRWSYETKIPANSKQRSERCGRITADVVKKAIEILNAKIDAGKDWKGAMGKQESVTQCGACHSKGKMSDIAKGNMDCTPCHSGNEHTGNKFENHPA